MKTVSFTMAVLLFISCSHVKCATDEKFINTYKANLSVITDFEEKNRTIMIQDYTDALSYVSKVTGIVTRAEYSSTVGYMNKQYYKEDMRKWRLWLKHNKCQFNTAMADSLLHR